MFRPDIDQIEIFTDALFRHARREGFVSLRSFYEDDSSKPFRITAASLAGGLSFINQEAATAAELAANQPRGIVFCPPIAVFSNRKQAREVDIAEGLALSVECDQHPDEAQRKLVQILGPATAVIRSGGKWTDPATGHVHNKLHLHWRLRVPARGDMLRELKQARDLASRLVGGDPSNKPVCHPIRWPGSWHKKAEPVLCRIDTANPDQEIDLTGALAALTAAQPKTGGNGPADGWDYREHARSDWSSLIAGILSGNDYHHGLVVIASKLIASGMGEGTAANMLRGLMEASSAPHDERWSTRFADIDRIAGSAATKFSHGRQTTTPVALPYISMAGWDDEPVPDQEWGVYNRYPLRQTSLLSGEGAAGKSLLQLQLCCAHVLGRDWLGTMPEQGPAIFIDAEDDAGLIHRRLANILAHNGSTFEALARGGLLPVSLAGHDAVLAAPTRSGKIEPTALYQTLLKDAGDIRPKLISIASSANVFAGSEIDRSQVQQFVSLMTRIAIASGGYLVLCAHPSLTGINTDTGLSGNTSWHASVRARAYLKSVKPENGEQADNDLRELVFKKSNYGPVSESIPLKYQNGLYLPLPGASSLTNAMTDDVFLTLLARFTKENRNVGDRRGPSYAPALFAQEDETKRVNLRSRDFESAMRRLFAAGKIWNEPYGKPSRPHYRIARKG